MRKAKIKRETKETKINLNLDLDGSGETNIDTGIGFFDHMLEQFCYHSKINLKLKVLGDLNIDFHQVIYFLIALSINFFQDTPSFYVLHHGQRLILKPLY